MIYRYIIRILVFIIEFYIKKGIMKEEDLIINGIREVIKDILIDDSLVFNEIF